MEDDDPRTFRVSGPLPPLEQPSAPLPQNPVVSTPDTKKQFLLGLVLGLLPLLFGLTGAAGGVSFLDVLAIFDFVLNLLVGAGLSLVQAKRPYGFGLLTGCFFCVFPFFVSLESSFEP